ncbi:hypothetical protein CORC01_13930 [Colletotrichum orchidophilum]|uniref:Uncharacterized protein n=1 Tax=Colletotrichum orchidophilum TaxID=1209926 RepID=A0A1G4ANI9_9PEZI|nr:uncharacterized protein CORC01_13930 [Colletotrichum orchidophilum]OHE90758.1 hypothetical protein CORC01_13930 [Colletotrichum orchidophilum]
MTWPNDAPNPSVRSIFQMIHHDVAYAAWLSVNIRLTHTILHFDWRQPGDHYLPGQVELTDPGVMPILYDALLSPESDVAVTPPYHAAQLPLQPVRSRVMISFVPLVQRVSLVMGANGEEPIGCQRTRLLESRSAYYTEFLNNTGAFDLFDDSLADHAYEMRRSRQSFRSALHNTRFLSTWAVMLLVLYSLSVRLLAGHAKTYGTKTQ